jgi:hypothetical protein
MADKTKHPVQAWIMSNPCFYLFMALLLLPILLPQLAKFHHEVGVIR